MPSPSSSEWFMFPIDPLDQESYQDFKTEISWDERDSAVHKLGMSAYEFVIGCKRANPPPYLSDQLREPESILANRRQIMESLIDHATEVLKIDIPVFSGRNGYPLLHNAQAPNLGRRDLIWATPTRIFRESIGSTMNNPFNYLYIKSRNVPDFFTPMIAVYDSNNLIPTNHNSYDMTSWRTKKDSVLDAVAALYYFKPTQLEI
jgi:hypothetical protein